MVTRLGAAKAWHNYVMRRTTIMADEDLLKQLAVVARREHVSLAEVIRQGLELRVRQARPRPRSIGAASVETVPRDLARQSSEMNFEPLSWR